MLMIIILLGIFLAILLITVMAQHSMVVISKRKQYILAKNIAKEREATADILTLSKDVITSANYDDEEFLSRFVQYALRTLNGSGAAVFQCRERGQFYGCAVAGTMPPVREVTAQIEQQLMAHPKKHTEFFKGLRAEFTDSDLEDLCNGKGFAFFKDKCPIWFPEKFVKEAPRILIAPIKIGDDTFGCIIVTSKSDFDSYKLSEEDGYYLVRLAEIASLSLEVLKVFKERQEYEVNLQAAREEGMMQVSTGIIHNIGNAITVAKLSVMELQERLSHKSDQRPENLILNEMLPKLKEQIDSGKIAEFLREDPAGSQYIEIMTELLKHVNNNAKESSEQLKSLSDKLYHISEIIELQQRFIGELGTENMTQLSGVIESSVKIFEETFNKRGVKIKTDIAAGVPEVLIDPSMMTQVFMNLIKNAVEAMDNESNADKEYSLEISLSEEEKREDGKKYAVVTVSDNGPGIPGDVKEKIFDFGFSTKGEGASHGYGLHSCKDTVSKYNGKIELDTEIGKGSAFKVSIPIGQRQEG